MSEYQLDIEELRLKLLEAYSTKNMNNISLTLINLYKNERFGTLRSIAELISDFVSIEINEEGKGFSKLIMLYHPDRCQFYETEINDLADSNDFDKLSRYAHILKLESIEEIADSLNHDEEIDYSPVYDWDYTADGFSIINDDKTEASAESEFIGYDFYDAVKIRQFGNTEIEFPSYYLEDIEEFELSSSNINDLEGVQYCIHAKSLDLSVNEISDISLLSGLKYLTELNLSDNSLTEIDAIINLTHLKRLSISNNPLQDISALFELESLEYVDISGNDVYPEQIIRLINNGVKVDF